MTLFDLLAPSDSSSFYERVCNVSRDTTTTTLVNHVSMGWSIHTVLSFAGDLRLMFLGDLRAKAIFLFS